MWEIRESEHYRFHFHNNSLAKKEIEKIIRKQESCFSYITKVLGIVPCFKINYYLCQSREEVGECYGDGEACNGFARKPDKIYAVYNNEIICLGFHEDAHIISYQLNSPKSVALREGLAMFFDRRWWSISNQDWVLYYLQTNQYYSIVKLLDDKTFYQVDCQFTYPIMGAFTEYLIMTYGRAHYLQWYNCKEDNLIEQFEVIYGYPCIQIEQAFIEYIKLFKLDEAIKTRMSNS